MPRDRRAAQFRGGRGVTTTRRAACVIGWPVEHSRSPLIHNYWLKHYGIAGEYRREAVPPAEFAAFIGSLAARGYVGANVTVPHKEAALALSQPDDARARSAPPTRCGSTTACCARPIPMSKAFWTISTPARRVGIAASARRSCSAPAARRAPSSTASSRAASSGSCVVNRTPGRAELLRQAFGARVRVGRWDELDAALADAALLVNTTTLGMQGQPNSQSIWRACPVTPSSPIWSMCRCGRRSSPRQRRALCAPPTGSACCCIRPCAALRCGSAKRPK